MRFLLISMLMSSTYDCTVLTLLLFDVKPSISIQNVADQVLGPFRLEQSMKLNRLELPFRLDQSMKLNRLELRGGHQTTADVNCLFHDCLHDKYCGIDGVDITPLGDGGVHKKFLSPGHAGLALSVGDEVSVYLIGTVTTPDGETITFLNHSSAPFTFKFGKGQVVSGLEMGVATMKTGEKSLFYVRPQYGYGDDVPWKNIGVNDTLVFEVELLCCGERDLTEGKGGVLFRCLHDPHGFDQPEPIDEALISLIGSHARDGREFARTESPVWVDMGSGLLPRGLVLGLTQMTPGMTARILLTGSWAFRYALS
jgi:hypothetical protein